MEEENEVLEETENEELEAEVERKDVEDDEFVPKKGKKDGEKSTISKVMNIALWVILFAWMGVCLFDFFTVKGGKAPTFCISKKTKTYSDGTVDTCIGAGYKVYNYKRDAIKAVEFGPLWAKERLSNAK